MRKILALVSISIVASLLCLENANAAPEKTYAADSLAVGPRAATETLKPTSASGRSTHRSDYLLKGRLEVEPIFGESFTDPGDINDLVHEFNLEMRRAGIPSFDTPDFSATSHIGLAATYRVIPLLGLGLGLNHLGATTESSTPIGNSNLDTEFNIAANLLTAESRITLQRSADAKWEIVAAPFLGIGFYSASMIFSGAALTKGAVLVDASATGPVIGATIGARHWFLKNLSGGLSAGYRYAKSGTLTVNNQQNANLPLGSEAALSSGKKIHLDMSSLMFSAHLTWAI